MTENYGVTEAAREDLRRKAARRAEKGWAEKGSPFSLGELGSLGQAWETDDVEYLKRWSKAAVSHYESEKNRLIGKMEKMQEKLGKFRNIGEAVKPFMERMKGVDSVEDAVNMLIRRFHRTIYIPQLDIHVYDNKKWGTPLVQIPEIRAVARHNIQAVAAESLSRGQPVKVEEDLAKSVDPAKPDLSLRRRLLEK